MADAKKADTKQNTVEMTEEQLYRDLVAVGTVTLSNGKSIEVRLALRFKDGSQTACDPDAFFSFFPWTSQHAVTRIVRVYTRKFERSFDFSELSSHLVRELLRARAASKSD